MKGGDLSKKVCIFEYPLLLGTDSGPPNERRLKGIIIAGISLLLGLESEKKNARPLLKNPSRGSGAIE